jgi:hypothetical protein
MIFDGKSVMESIYEEARSRRYLRNRRRDSSHMQVLNNYIITNCEPSQLARIAPVLTACVAELDIEISRVNS